MYTVMLYVPFLLMRLLILISTWVKPGDGGDDDDDDGYSTCSSMNVGGETLTGPSL